MTVRLSDTASNLTRAREALLSINPGLPRDEWVMAGMAAHAAGLDFETFNTWSAGARNYDPKAARDTWRSIKPGKGIGPGTLFCMAKKHGWRDSNPSRNATPVLDVSGPPTTPQEPRKATSSEWTPEAIWSHCTPAAGHPYIAAKQGIPEGLRVVPDDNTLTIAKKNLSGWLVVPAYAPDGTLQSLQFISAPGQGKKLNMPHAPMAGASFTVGNLAPGGVVYVVEGIGQAWACWKATGFAAVVAFGWHNVARVADNLRQQDHAARLVIVPDRGKEADAEKIACKLRAAVASMPQDEPENFDANDYGQRDGLDALEHLLLQASAAPPLEPRYKLLTAADLEAKPPIEWRIKGVLPTRGLAQIYGPSMAGKSFLALDMACAIAGSVKWWFGYHVKAAPVVYVVLEGEPGFKLRAEAWKHHTGRPLPANLHLVMQPWRINDSRDVQDLAAVVPAGAVVIIDTQNRAAPTTEENSSKDMGEILEGAKVLQSLTAGMVVLVAHPGKDVSKGPRGHSSQTPAVDTAIEVSRKGDRHIWKAAKVKDGADGAEHHFHLEVIVLGTDDDGDPLTSCAIATDGKAASPSRTRPTTEAQRRGIDSYRAAAERVGLTDDAGRFIGLHLDAWRDYYYRMSTADSVDAKRKAFQRSRHDLVERGDLTVTNDVYRPAGGMAGSTEARFTMALAQVKPDEAVMDGLPASGTRDTSGTLAEHVPAAHTETKRDRTGHAPLGVSRVPVEADG